MDDSHRNFILFDDLQRDHLLPFAFTRPVAEIRIGILTIREKWEKWTGRHFSHLTQDYLQEKYPLVTGEENVVVNGSVTPNRALVEEILKLNSGEVLVRENLLIAACFDRPSLNSFNRRIPEGCTIMQAASDFRRVSKLWHIFLLNGDELRSDFEIVTSGRNSCPVSSTNNLLQPDQIFMEEGARMEFATINAARGPVYIGRNAEVMEGAMIRGPFALGEGGWVKMGAMIYGPTTVGPYCKVGGEVTNAVFFGFSNKVHDGYVGNSVIGEWCNIGAGSNISNLKNNFTLVKVFNYSGGREEETGLQFCGLFMGDYSRCGINTMFNTGTVVGVSSNVYGTGFPGGFIPSFSWGGASGFETYRLGKAIETIQTVVSMRQMEITETEKQIISKVFTLTDRYRKSV